MVMDGLGWMRVGGLSSAGEGEFMVGASGILYVC